MTSRAFAWPKRRYVKTRRVPEVICSAVLAVAFTIPGSGVGAQPDKAPICESVRSCVVRAREVADPSDGITDQEQAVAKRLQALGPQAILPLLGLLEDHDRNVRELAGYILRDMRGLTPSHLPALEQAVEEGDGWLPPAIASIGTPEAVRFLVGELRKNPETHTQLTYAFERLGPAAFPELLELFRCGSCDEALLSVVGFILSEIRHRAGDVVEPLAQIATEGSSSPIARRSAVRALAGLGATAQPAVKTLLDMTNQPPVDLQAVARKAVVAIGGPGTKEILDSSLDEAGDKRFPLRDVAALGEAGRSAGPRVVRLLGSGSADVRVAAARTLGFIGYVPSAPSLASALDDRDDWRLVYVAAEALGRLRATDERLALEATATGHWYPPVREAARKAVTAPGSKRPLSEPNGPNFGREFFDYEQVGRDLRPCAGRAQFPAAPQRPETLDPAAQPALAEQLAYGREVRSFDEKGEHTTRRRTVPQVGLRVQSGWLVGGDHGEWGGELMLRADAGTTSRVLTENVSGLHFLSDGQIVAVAGLVHLGMDEGVLYRVTCSSTKGCSASRWKQLPGAPQSSWMTETGELLVNTTRASVIVAPDGTMRMAECHARAPSPTR